MIDLIVTSKEYKLALCRKSWLSSGYSGFFPQGKLTGGGVGLTSDWSGPFVCSVIARMRWLLFMVSRDVINFSVGQL